MNLVLIGFRATGKTTVGKLLANKLLLEFMDADELIEKRFGFTITEMFQQGHESLFRMLESDLINELSKYDSRVIAVGGGAIMKYKNYKNLKRRGVIFLLEADADTIYDRIMADDKTRTQRPRLTDMELRQEIKKLLEFRYHYYHRACDCVINTANKRPRMVLDEILYYLRQEGHIPP
ncbi:MAG: shikimate kinase [Planctomycetes bacterium]|nr:shikimate kinase [Planctomycetota bacterium]